MRLTFSTPMKSRSHVTIVAPLSFAAVATTASGRLVFPFIFRIFAYVFPTDSTSSTPMPIIVDFCLMKSTLEVKSTPSLDALQLSSIRTIIGVAIFSCDSSMSRTFAPLELPIKYSTHAEESKINISVTPHLTPFFPRERLELPLEPAEHGCRDVRLFFKYPLQRFVKRLGACGSLHHFQHLPRLLAYLNGRCHLNHYNYSYSYIFKVLALEGSI